MNQVKIAPPADSNAARKSFLVTVLLALGLVLLTLLVFRFIYFPQSDEVSITFFDVGQGDAVLVEVPNGSRWLENNQLLIDGGPNQSVLRGLGAKLPLFDRNIEYVVATHPDTDHIGGLVEVLQHYQVAAVIDSGIARSTEVYQKYAAEVARSQTYHPANQVRQIKLGDKLTLTILPVPVLNEEINDRSIVTRVDYGSNSVLLTGDASTEVEAYLIKNYGSLLDVDVLKLGHHGSRTSTSSDFLAITSPEYVVISAPLDSPYGHPHSEVINNLKNYGNATVLYTGQLGDITFSSTFDSEFEVSTEKPPVGVAW